MDKKFAQDLLDGKYGHMVLSPKNTIHLYHLAERKLPDDLETLEKIILGG